MNLDLDDALTRIQALALKPAGVLRISSPVFLGQHYLMLIISDFMNSFQDIQVNLIVSNQRLDPIKEKLDLVR
jgi:DNA-binding transcriptional LysR family regulator